MLRTLATRHLTQTPPTAFWRNADLCRDAGIPTQGMNSRTRP